MVGTPLQGSNDDNFIYDTGSGYLTVPTNHCFTCEAGFSYDSSKSSTFSDSNGGYAITSLTYGSAALRGSVGTDTVCLGNNTNSCVSEFSFFMIKS